MTTARRAFSIRGAITAGDLRSASYQLITTATGSGADAALHAYYAARDKRAA
ncbi:hypothetical protein GCM10009716_47580 [Streptomyces sodiiphilus]|uniref:Uncharacterized protein n=1 Tax=Streptomyces sodiiphilus TaxID=226217 RepID=A0ABN2PWA6_9ACTN